MYSRKLCCEGFCSVFKEAKSFCYRFVFKETLSESHKVFTMS